MKYYSLSGSACTTFYAVDANAGVCQSMEVWRKNECIDWICIGEYTVEAGTYDTIANTAIQSNYKELTLKEWNAAKKEVGEFLKKIGSSV